MLTVLQVNMINHTVKSCQITVLEAGYLAPEWIFGTIRVRSFVHILSNMNIIFDILRFDYLNYIKLVCFCHIRTYIGCRIGYPPKGKRLTH